MYPEPEEGISIDELIDLNHEVLSSLPADQSNARCTVLFNVSLLLRARYEERGKMQDLNDVITHIEQAVELSSDSNVSHLLTWLGRNLIRRFKTTEANPVDLNRAIDQFRSADALFIHGEEYAGTNHCHLLLELSEALEMRSNHTRQSYHRGKSDQVDARSGAVNLDLHPTSSILESTTDSTRFSSSENSPGLIDLDDSIQCIKQCIELMGEDPIELGHSLDRLSKALYLRFEILGTVDDLEEAIRSNTEDTPIPQSDRRSFQHFANLGACYWARYSAVSGANTDLQTAIRLTRRSLELDSCRGAGRGAVFASLANCLVYRDRELSHDQLDVTEAIQCARSALSLLTDLSHQASTYLILSKALQGLYDYSNAMRDLEAAIRAAEHAVALQGGSDEFGQLSILLYIRWQRMKSDEDLRGAIQFGQEAISPKLPALYGNRGTLVANLARCLETRYLISKDRAHLEETINLLRNTLSSSTQMINGRAECLSRLASALQRLYRLEPDPTLLREVRDMVIEAFDHGDPDLTKLFRMAGDWVAGAIEPSLRLEMYPVLLDITQRHLLIHPDIMCQHRKLLSDTPLGELSANVAGDAITAQRLQEAVEIIEKGRLLLLRCLMALRTPVDEVRLVDPILAERLEEIAVRREELAQKPFHLLSPSMKSTTLDSDLKEQAALVHEWERLLVEIRSHDELRGFLKPPSFSALRESASKGPVIVINVCKRRCDAIIVLSTGAPVLVELTKISYKTIVRMRQELIFSQRALVSPPDALLLLRTLWIKIVEPIVNRLLELDFKEGQRIWWCPSSIATYLPFHAAGPYQEGMKNLPDYFISSYTASLEALIRARSAKSDSQATSALPRVLFVGHPGMEDELDSVKLELAILESREDISTTVLFKEAATPSAVLHHLPKHPWVHLACHGKLDEWSPVGSYFQLHNRDPLLVREILHARLANARLAVLTACYTAAPGPMTPDEGLHLASALQFAGFSSVIGTLWEMFDSEAQVITESFYNELMRLGGDHEDSARALHYATEQQRLSGKGPRLWMMLIHIGA
jgi:CHAT domain-containing protein/tetratricopeptide (TPR) repeat protein